MREPAHAKSHRTVLGLAVLLIAVTTAIISYRLRHPPTRAHAQPPVPLPNDAGEYRVITFSRGSVEWTVRCAHLRPNRYTLSLIDAPDTTSPGTWIQPAASDAGALVAVNGGYFDEHRQPLGWRVSAGRESSPLLNRPPLSGLLYSRPDGNAQISPITTPPLTLPNTAIQSGPLLIEPGGLPGIRSDTGPTAVRTVAATTPAGDLLLITTSPVTLHDLSRSLLDSPTSFGVDRIDCALNLDGGPSTAMLVRTPTSHDWTPPHGPVRDALLALPTTP